METAEFILFMCTLIGALSAFFSIMKSKKESDMRIGKVDTELLYLSSKINSLDNDYNKMYTDFSNKIDKLENKYENMNKEVMAELKAISSNLSEIKAANDFLRKFFEKD